MAKIVCIGEAMVELSRRGNDWALGHGGDTLNTAIHLSRLGHDVSYLSALGADPFSDELRMALEGERVDCSLILTHPARNVGLYAITNDDRGERSFTYWRDRSAAKEMFALPQSGAVSDSAMQCDLVYFSLISLAILPAEGRSSLLELARRARQAGARVAFDGNYRPRLWPDTNQAVAMHGAAIAVSDIGLPTLDDEIALSGAADADAVARHWDELGCAECVVKLGAAGCLLPDGRVVKPAQVLSPIDTSGAGDAFNAGYLSSRLNGGDPASAAKAGHLLAGWTVMRSGAIPAKDAEYPSLSL